MKRLSSEKVVDAHQHFWELGGSLQNPGLQPGDPVMYRSYLPSDLRPLLAEAGVDETVVVQGYQLPEEGVAETRWHLQLAQAHPFIAGVVGWVDLADPQVGRTLDELQASSKFKGVRHLVEMEPDDAWLARAGVLRGLQELARRGLAYDLLVRLKHFRHVLALYERAPDLRMVIDHCAKPDVKNSQFDDWAAGLAQLAAIPSVYCKLSGLTTEADWNTWRPADLRPYYHAVVEIFGYDRVMYGSDWPVVNLAGDYGRQLAALAECLGPLEPEQAAKVFGRNARTFYHLE